MKRRLFTFALAALTIGLLGSCSKINERIDGLDKRVYDLENNKIASVEQQITAINTSINELKAADVTINGKIADLKTAADAQQALIDALQEADRALGQKDAALEARIATLEGQVTTINGQIDALVNADIAINTRIDTLSTYVDTQIGKAKDWATASFASLTEYQQTAENLAALSVTVTGISTTLAGMQTSIAELDTKIDGIDSALQDKITTAKTELEGKISDLKTELEGEIAEAIATSEAGLKGWVNEQLSGYYTIAQVDAKVDGIQSDIDALKTDNETNKSDIEKLEADLAKLTQDLATAKADIETAYKKAIKDAIEGNDGYITETIKTAIATANGKIDDLTERVGTLESDFATLKNDVTALKAMIQTVSIIPAYSNGSLKAEDGILTINCVITPKEAVESLKKENFTILTSESEVLTKSALYGTLTIAKDEDLVLDKTNGTATIKVDVSSVLPAEEDKALTVAVNIKNGISDFTTEFVPVYVYVAPTPTTTGTAKATIGELQVDVRWIQLWENGPKFAEYNVGVTNGKAESYGGYYTWGGTYNNDSYLPGFSWNDDHNLLHTTDNDNLTSTEDTATKLWGENWRMPTKAELEALINSTNCTVEWTTVGGVYGRKFTGKTEPYSSNSVFLPAAGCCYKNSDGDIEHDSGRDGYYWSSTSNGSNSAYFLYFFESSFQTVDGNARYIGSSVRAVLAE